LPAELNRRGRDKTPGILLHSDALWDDEVCVRDGNQMTTPARTAFDLFTLCALPDAGSDRSNVELTGENDWFDRQFDVRQGA
jgi:hypothetical protein